MVIMPTSQTLPPALNLRVIGSKISAGAVPPPTIRTSFSRLLISPLSGWMATHVEVKNTPTTMRQDWKHVENLEPDGGDREDRARDALNK
jgi:hypothetical protein